MSYSDALTAIILEHLEILRGDPNAIGELLRAWAFPGEEYGCYSTFELLPEFVKVEAGPREFAFLWGRPFDPGDTEENGLGYCDVAAIKEISWFKHPNGIEVGWYWDGDGTLAFHIPEQPPEHRTIHNTDCKHDDEWKFVEVSP